MSNNDLPRANYDDLEFDDQQALLNDVPFTGIVYAVHENGQLEMEYNYVDGLPSGLQREWHPNGQLGKESYAIRGNGSTWRRNWYPDGQLEEERHAIVGQSSIWSRKWYPNGIMKSEQINENYRPVRIREWSEDGRLLSDTAPDAAEHALEVIQSVKTAPDRGNPPWEVG